MTFNMKSYQKEYQKEKYDRIELKIKKGSKNILKEHVQKQNTNINEYIKRLINKDSGIDV